MRKINSKGMLTHTYKCGLCHDTGYVIQSVIVPEYDPETPVNIGDPCPVCCGRTNDYVTGIPSMFSEVDINHFDFGKYELETRDFEKIARSFFERFEEWEKSGKGLYLWSKTPGSGKTFLACCLALSINEKYKRRIAFIPVPEYLAKVSESYKKEAGEQSGLYAYKNCDLLILDDLGSEKRGEWQNQELFHLINDRMNQSKPTIVTSNIPLSELKCEERIINRLNKQSIPLHFPEVSIRTRLADEENKKFLKSVLA